MNSTEMSIMTPVEQRQSWRHTLKLRMASVLISVTLALEPVRAKPSIQVINKYFQHSTGSSSHVYTLFMKEKQYAWLFLAILSERKY